jgi:acetylornithine deacetylase/succinyl-diaminopimelate desuccinylase-like protein
VPTAVFGPGRISDAHVKDEFVEERSVVEAVKLLALALAHYLDLGADE